MIHELLLKDLPENACLYLSKATRTPGLSQRIGLPREVRVKSARPTPSKSESCQFTSMLLPIREEMLGPEAIPVFVFSNVPLVLALEGDPSNPTTSPLLHVLFNRTIPAELVQELDELSRLHLVLAHELNGNG